MVAIQKKSVAGYIFDGINALLICSMILITLYPMLYVLFASLSDPRHLLSHDGMLFYPVGNINLKGYELVFQNPNIMNGFRNTALYVLVGTTINVLLTALGAFVLTRKHFVIRKFCSILVLLTMFFSGGMIPTFFVVQKLGLYDNFWALVLPNAISVYNMIIMRTFFLWNTGKLGRIGKFGRRKRLECICKNHFAAFCSGYCCNGFILWCRALEFLV